MVTDKGLALTIVGAILVLFALYRFVYKADTNNIITFIILAGGAIMLGFGVDDLVKNTTPKPTDAPTNPATEPSIISETNPATEPTYEQLVNQLADNMITRYNEYASANQLGPMSCGSIFRNVYFLDIPE